MSRLVVDTAADRLAFDEATGRLVSIRPLAAPGTELIASVEDDPIVEVGYLDGGRAFRSVDDRSATAREVRLRRETDGSWELETEVHGLGGLTLDATVTVRGGPDDRSAAWSVRVHDATAPGLRLTHVAFPWVAVRVARSPGPSDRGDGHRPAIRGRPAAPRPGARHARGGHAGSVPASA